MTALSSLLSGLRVLDLTRNLPGPFATRMLADLGAHVVKVEPPEGDPARGLPPLYAALTPGKEVRTLDFRQPSDLDVLRGWIADCDVLIEGFRPGVMAAMGLGFEQLKALQPRLIACSISGYGQHGPMSDQAGHDVNYMAMSGALDQLRSADGEIALSNIQWGDLAGGASMATIAILAALFDVNRRQAAVHLDVSMTHGLWAHQVMPQATGQMVQALSGRWPGPGEDLLNGALPCYNVYRTLDGRHLAVGSLEHKFWALTCGVLGRPGWAAQHWQRGLLPNSPESNALREEVARLVASETLATWVDRFQHVDACVTPVLTLNEAREHPLFAHPRNVWSVTV